jgi:hypothetical protein
MHRGIGNAVAADKAESRINVDVVFIAEVTLAMLFRPAGVGIFLGQFVGAALASLRGWLLV